MAGPSQFKEPAGFPQAKKPRWPSRGKRQTNPAWRRSRAWTFERSGGRCEARQHGCTGRAEQAHHIRRRSQGGSDDPSNLLAVCGRCHTWIHSNPAEARELGFLRFGIDNWEQP